MCLSARGEAGYRNGVSRHQQPQTHTGAASREGTETPTLSPLWKHRRLLQPLRRVRTRMRAHPLLNTTWRAGVFVIGWLVVLAGVIMLAIPGPGMLATIVGFAILATEFVWARHLLRKTRRAAEAAKERAMDPKVRRRNQILGGCAIIMVAVATGAYVWQFGLGLPPVP